MKPVVLLSLLVLALVIFGAFLTLLFLMGLPPMGDYGNWPFYMLGTAVFIVIALAALYFWLMFYSARHHDHKIFKPEDFEHWRDE